MLRCVDLVWTDVSEECIASFFRVEKSASEEPGWTGECSLQPPANGFFYPEDGGDTFLRNVRSHKIYTAQHSRRLQSS
jgi:hypothetical protein